MYKRFETRKLAAVPMEVICSQSDIPLDYVTWEMSPQGAYFMTDQAPLIGEQMVCAFSLSGISKEYCFLAEVCRVNKGRRKNDFGPVGFGVHFIDTRPIERLKIRSALGLSDAMASLPRRQ